ncbi:MAG: hypothetical protein O3A51_07775 [Verrucomicrobia bacterium]|nr:hypothetical protein [Verrucomicrobiota bacterium]
MTYQPPSYGYDPRGSVEADRQELAPRLADLNGIRIAVLDNAKMKAHKLLDYTTDQLRKDFDFVEVNYYLKEGFSYTATPEMIAEIAANNDAVITAIGD